MAKRNKMVWESVMVRDKMVKKDHYEFEPTTKLFSIFCRSVGSGGTTVTFYKTASGNVKAIWVNENCPYGWSDNTIHLVTEESTDGHNVNELGSLKEFLALLGKNSGE